MVKRKLSVLFFASLLIFVSGCWQKKQSLYVINVLDKSNYDECHIKGSTSVPYAEIKSWAQSIPKDTEIVVYCANYACTASGFGAQQLIDMGFDSVWAYESGMHDWHAKGFPEVCPVESSYLTQPNRAPEEEATVPTLTTEELYQKMLAHGLLSQ